MALDVTYKWEKWSYWGAGNGGTVHCGDWVAHIWESDINTSNNTSVINVHFYVIRTGSGKSQTYNLTTNNWAQIKINDTQLHYQKPAKFDIRTSVASGTVYNLGTVSKRITHDGNGNASVHVYCQHYCGNTTPDYVTFDKWVNLTNTKPAPQIVYASDLYVKNGTYDVGSTVNYTLSTNSWDLSHEVMIRPHTDYVWRTVLSSRKITPNIVNYYSFVIPKELNNGIAQGGTVTMDIQMVAIGPGSAKIIENNPITIRNGNISYTSELHVSGSYNIGSKVTYQIVTSTNTMDHEVFIRIPGKSWIQVLTKSKLTPNILNYLEFTIPDSLKDFVGAQQTSELEVYLKSTLNGTVKSEKSKIITIKNNEYYLRVDSLHRIENDPIYAGITRPGFRMSSTATYGVKQAEFSFVGANKATGYVYQTTNTIDFWPLVFDKIGTTTLSVRVQDNRGHWSGWKSISFNVVEEPHRLSITNLSDQNQSVAIGQNCFKINCSWDNTHSISYIKFTISGANSFTKTITNPTGNSYTWNTSIPYNLGSNTVQVEIKDIKGKVVTKSIKVNTVYPNNALSVNASYNTAKCNLIKGIFFKDHSNLSLDITIEHLFKLKSLTVNVFNKTHEVSINENTTSVTWNYGKITQSGTFTITVTARDVYDKIATKQISLDSLILIQPAPVPQIQYVTTEEKLFLSEGHKVKFTGTSTNIKDYKIICAYQNCDVAKATSYCDAYSASYLNSDKTQLKTSLLNNLTGNLSYAVYKDFDETHAGIHVKSDDKKTFYLYPESADSENTDYYALQWSDVFKPGGLVTFYVIERRQGNFEMLYSTDKAWNAIPLNELFKMCVIPPAPCSLQIRKRIQTSDKLIIEYNNPTKKIASAGNTPIHLVDICMVVKNQQGEIINKTNDKKRDVNNGKQWMYYTKRFYHYVTPKAPEVYELEIDITSYPIGSAISLIAFYYADWFTNPSVYSTSNILNTEKQNVAMKLAIDKPNDNSEVDSLNPNIKVTVHNTSVVKNTGTYLFEPDNWKLSYTINNGVYYKVPRSKDFHMPNFKDADLYKPNNILDTVTQQVSTTKELSLYNAGTVNNNTIFGKFNINPSCLKSSGIETETHYYYSMMWWSWNNKINFDDIEEITFNIKNDVYHNTNLYVAKTSELDNTKEGYPNNYGTVQNEWKNYSGCGYINSYDNISNHKMIQETVEKNIPQGTKNLTFDLSNLKGEGYLTIYFQRYENKR